MRSGTVPGDDRFQKGSVKVLQRVAGSIAQTGGPFSQLRPDKRQPNVALDSHLGSQTCGRAAWMRFQEIFHVIFYDVRKLFNAQCDHN